MEQIDLLITNFADFDDCFRINLVLGFRVLLSFVDVNYYLSQVTTSSTRCILKDRRVNPSNELNPDNIPPPW
jgi:hypothetical protein